MSIVETILSQLGGRRFLVMTGSYDLIGCDKEKHLCMRLRRNVSKFSRLKVKLMADDTYTMHFFRFLKGEIVSYRAIDGLYCEDLARVFEDVTGLRTSL